MNKKDSLMNQNDVHLVVANVEVNVVEEDLVVENGYNTQ
jgi:hypothetical protein